MRLTHIIAIDFQYSWMILKKSFKWSVLAAVIALLISLLVVSELDIEGSYRATATLYSFDSSNLDNTSVGLEALQRYSEMIKSRRIAEIVAETLEVPDLDADTIYEMLSTEARYTYSSTVRYSSDLTVIPVYADSSNKEYSISVANAAADAFVSEINSLLGEDVIRVLDYAYTTETIENEMIIKGLVLGGSAVLAACLTMMCFVLRVILSTKVQTMTDLSLYGQITILGVLPENR